MAVFYNISSVSKDPAGIKVIENPTKTLKGILFPRTCLPEFNKMAEANQAGVYILYNTRDRNEQPHICIGQADDNIASHLKENDKHKNIWDQALVFIEKSESSNLNFIHTRIMKSVLISEAVKDNAIVINNAPDAKFPKPQKIDQLTATTWADEIITITKILGLTFFAPQVIEKPKAAEPKASDKNVLKGEWDFIPDGLYTMARTVQSIHKICTGIMEVRDGHCILKAGSDISPIKNGMNKKWEKLWEKLHQAGDSLAEDVLIDSPVGCASMVTGANCNVWITWKNEQGDVIDIYRNKPKEQHKEKRQGDIGIESFGELSPEDLSEIDTLFEEENLTDTPANEEEAPTEEP